jgi:hypothetical protein
LCEYSDKNNTKLATINNHEWKIRIPIIGIYFLEHKLDSTDASIIGVNRSYKDLVTGELLTVKESFIESLTHDSYVIQIPQLAQKRRNELEILLSIFDQSIFVDMGQHFLNIKEEDYPDNYRPIIHRLQAAILELEIRKQIEIEDGILDDFENMQRELLNLSHKIAEAKQGTDGARQETAQARREADEARPNAAESDRMAEEARQETTKIKREADEGKKTTCSRSNHYCLQLNSVSRCSNKLLPAVTGKWHFLNSEQTCGNQNINILLDRASVTMQTMRYNSYGRRVGFCCAKKFKPGRRHYRKHITWVFKHKGEVRLWNFSTIYLLGNFTDMCKIFIRGSCFNDYVAHCNPPKPLTNLVQSVFQFPQSLLSRPILPYL